MGKGRNHCWNHVASRLKNGTLGFRKLVFHLLYQNYLTEESCRVARGTRQECMSRAREETGRATLPCWIYSGWLDFPAFVGPREALWQLRAKAHHPRYLPLPSSLYLLFLSTLAFAPSPTPCIPAFCAGVSVMGRILRPGLDWIASRKELGREPGRLEHGFWSQTEHGLASQPMAVGGHHPLGFLS